MPTIDETIAFIRKAHAGQTTKGGEPYWTHPVAVMTLLRDHVANGTATEDELHAALLHDVLEDTETTARDLRAIGYSDATIEIVRLVTRQKSEYRRPTYMEWIRNIAASGNVGAIRVKLADNMHNSHPERVANLPPEERDIVKRYERSMRILQGALTALPAASPSPHQG